jgi:hypothetical protein
MLAASLATPAALRAQEAATIAGRVIDEGGGVVPLANFYIEALGSARVRTGGTRSPFPQDEYRDGA